MITVDTFFSGTLATVDTVIGQFVQQAYSHFVQANATVITLLFTFHIMLLGYRFLTHTHHLNLSTMMRHLVVMLSVFGLVMRWDLYNLFVYNIFTNEPAYITQMLVGSSSQSQTIAQTLDSLYELVIKTTLALLGQVNFSMAGIAFIIYAGIVYVAGNLLCVIALLIFIYAKMMMAVALALGPLFILFILWQPTQGLFSAWLGKLITLALIPVVTTAVLMLMLTVVNVTLPPLQQPPENIQFYGIAPFIGLALTTSFILTHVFKICSALGGGITISSLSDGIKHASNVLSKSGLTSLGGFLNRRSTHSINSNGNSVRNKKNEKSY